MLKASEDADGAEEDADAAEEDADAEADASVTGGTASSVFSAENGHEHTYTKTVLKPATCTEAGEVQYTCYCGDSYVDPIPALAHTPGQWITVRVATTTQTGLRQQSCTVCGRVIDEEVLPMLPAPTTDTSSSSSKTSSTTNDHKHTYTFEITQEAACTEKGEKTYTCTTCGSTFTTTIPATNHPSRKTVRTEGDCANPGKLETICNICSAVISSEALVYNHEWGSWETTTEPTTTSKGVKTRTCKVCKTTETKSISRLSSSSASSTSTTSSTSTSSTSTSSTNTSSSGTSSSSTGTSSTGTSTTSHTHTYTSAVTQEATCTEAGITTYTCTAGDSVYTESAPAALGHKASGTWVITKKATTSEEGERVQYCSRCGEITVTEPIAKLQEVHTHSYTTTITRQPTCGSTGTRLHVCSCGDSYTSSIAATGQHSDSDGDGRCDVCGTSMK